MGLRISFVGVYLQVAKCSEHSRSVVQPHDDKNFRLYPSAARVGIETFSLRSTDVDELFRSRGFLQCQMRMQHRQSGMFECFVVLVLLLFVHLDVISARIMSMSSAPVRIRFLHHSTVVVFAPLARVVTQKLPCSLRDVSSSSLAIYFRSSKPQRSRPATKARNR